MDRKVPLEDHWWGFAVMPEAMDYPYNGDDNPLTLVCQFHYAEGMVYVFADLDYFFGYEDVASGSLGEWSREFFSVRYAPLEGNMREHEIRNADGSSAVPEAQPLDAPAKRGEMSAVLKPAQAWQDELEQQYPGYEVLLTLDECDEIGLRFYDCGTLFFLIKPDDLAGKRFDRVKCILFSY